MFTGIVEETGIVEAVEKGVYSSVLSIQAKKVLEGLKIGDSIAVNGICLTVTACSVHGFTADVMHETLSRSSLAELKQGTHVNLERAVPVNGRLGGHIVAGHADGVGRIQQIRKDDTAVWYTILAKPAILRYIVEKGSITVDGISLTVAGVKEDSFCVSVIPHTVSVTILKERQTGDLVNLENDIIGKYVEKLLYPAAGRPKGSTITKEFLSRHGF